MDIFYIVLSTLIIYSSISTVTYIVFKENEEVLLIFGLGPVGLTLLGILKIIRKIKNIFKYMSKRSIFEDRITGNKYKCKIKDTNNIEWLPEYKLLRRYATKADWETIPDFSDEVIDRSKKNCDNCKYNKECLYNVKCKNDCGTVIDFDHFESC